MGGGQLCFKGGFPANGVGFCAIVNHDGQIVQLNNQHQRPCYKKWNGLTSEHFSRRLHAFHATAPALCRKPIARCPSSLHSLPIAASPIADAPSLLNPIKGGAMASPANFFNFLAQIVIRTPFWIWGIFMLLLQRGRCDYCGCGGRC